MQDIGFVFCQQKSPRKRSSPFHAHAIPHADRHPRLHELHRMRLHKKRAATQARNTAKASSSFRFGME